MEVISAFIDFMHCLHGGKMHHDEPLEDPFSNIVFVDKFESI